MKGILGKMAFEKSIENKGRKKVRGRGVLAILQDMYERQQMDEKSYYLKNGVVL